MRRGPARRWSAIRYRNATTKSETPRTNTPPGFEKIADEFYNDDRAMTQDAFVDYQLTISNFVAAAERGTPRTELRDWLMLSTDPLFGGAETRIVRFLGSITCLRGLA